MKNTLFFLIAFFCCNIGLAQNKNLLKFKSISTGFGICVGELNDGGLNFYIDATTEFKRNLFTFSFVAGGELQLFDASRDYKELDFMYGRELTIYKFFKTEVNTGIAIFNEVYKNGSTNFNKVSETAIGLPIKVKLLFYVSDHFAFGLNPNITINSIDTMYSGNLIFQYRF